MSTEYLSLEEISRRLHISPATVRNRLSRQDSMPPSIKIGRRRLFPEDQFDLWIESFKEDRSAI